MHQGDGGLAPRGARRFSSSTRPLASARARSSRATPTATLPTAGCPPCGSWWRISVPTSTPATTTATPPLHHAAARGDDGNDPLPG